MGNAGTFHYAFAFAAFAGLTGCSDNRDLWRESEIRAIAEETAADAVAEQTYAIDGNAEAGNRLVERVDELETEVKFLESKIGILESQIESDGKTIDFLLSEAQKIP